MADTLDIFEDGSCLDLITLDNNVDTVNNGSLTIVGDPATYGVGKYGSSFISTTATTCKMASPRIMGGSFASAGAISFFIKPTSIPTEDKVPFLYDDPIFGGLYLAFYNTQTAYRIVGGGKANGTFSLPVGTWTHICYVCDTVLDKDIIYVNGILNESKDRVDRQTLSIDEMWVGGITYNSSEYRGDHEIDQIRFFNRALTDTKIGILNTEPEFGVIFRDRRSVFGDHYLSFKDRREIVTIENTSIFKDRRILFAGNTNIFKDRRELNAIENIIIFSDKRLCTADMNIDSFLDKRFVDRISTKSFKDRREVEPLHKVSFLDRRDIHKGGGIVFSDRRLIHRDLRYLSFRDVRMVETVFEAIIIERTNI